ncbi:MAG: MCP four helix bundle domain-containing protein, partial [Treponema sp.]|nr:MCP four helix bundle domain-containing protein [Treponema sp.]
MRNMNVSIKLAMSFLILSIMTIITGVVGIGGMTRINSGSREMYESQSQPLADLGIAREYFQRLRVQLRDVVLASGNTLELDVIAAYLVNHEQGFIRYIEAYRRTITDPDMIALYDEIMAAFGEYQPSMQQIMASARVSAPPVQMLIMMNGLEEPTNFVMDALSYLAYVRV